MGKIQANRLVLQKDWGNGEQRRGGGGGGANKELDGKEEARVKLQGLKAGDGPLSLVLGPPRPTVPIKFNTRLDEGPTDRRMEPFD